MHVDRLCAGFFMQPVYVLCDKGDVPGEIRLKSRKGLMRGVRLCICGLDTTCIVEAMDQGWIAHEGLGCGHVFDPVLRP